MANTNSKKPLYNLNGTLEGDVIVKDAQTKQGPKPFAIVRVKGSKRSTTVMTFVKSGIAALQGRKAGESIRLFGTFNPGKARTFAAMGISPEKAPVEAPAEA